MNSNGGKMRNGALDTAPAGAGRSPRRTARFTPLGLLCLAIGLGALTGCATQAPRFAVEINALSALPEDQRPSATPLVQSTSADPSQAPPTVAFEDTQYLLLAADPDKDTRDLQHREFEEVLEAALLKRGLERVDVASEADVAILMDYGIGERVTEVISISTPHHVLNDARFRRSRFRYGRQGRRGRRGRAFGDYPYSSFDRFAYQPRVQTRTVTTVNRFLELEARALTSIEAPRSGDPLWSTEARSRGPIEDLRRVFPVLVGAAADYVGSDSGQIIETTIAEDDARVIQLRPMFDPTGAALQDPPASAESPGEPDSTKAER